MRHFKDILLSLFAALCIVAVVQVDQSYGQRFLMNPKAMEINTMVQDTEVLPEEIQGVWTYEGELIDQRLLLWGNQFVVQDDYSGTVFYTIDRIEIEQSADGTNTYQLEWSSEDFADRYGNQALEDMGEVLPFVFIYDAHSDTLTTENQAMFERDYQREIVLFVKEALSESQPINQQHLDEVDDTFLYETYQTFSDQNISEAEILEELYLTIAEAYPSLELVTGESYHRYMQVIQTFEQANSDLTMLRINQANPATVLEWASAYDIEEEAEALVLDLTPKIEAAVSEYFQANFREQNALRIP